MVKRITHEPPGSTGEPGDEGPSNPALDGLADQADALNGGGDGTEGGAAPGGAPGEAAPVVTNATLISGVLEVIREGFCFATKLESPRRTFTSDHATQLGTLWGAVCDARGIDLKRWLGDFALEAVAAAVTLQVLGEVRTAVNEELAQRKAAADAAKGAQTGGEPGDEGQGQT